MPLQQWALQCSCDFFGQHGLAGARFALYKQWSLQCKCGIHSKFQIVCGDIALGAGESFRRKSGYSRSHRVRSEEHTSELQSLLRISYAVFCLTTPNPTPHKTANSGRTTTNTKDNK